MNNAIDLFADINSRLLLALGLFVVAAGLFLNFFAKFPDKRAGK